MKADALERAVEQWWDEHWNYWESDGTVVMKENDYLDLLAAIRAELGSDKPCKCGYCHKCYDHTPTPQRDDSGTDELRDYGGEESEDDVAPSGEFAMAPSPPAPICAVCDGVEAHPVHKMREGGPMMWNYHRFEPPLSPFCAVCGMHKLDHVGVYGCSTYTQKDY